ncbi:hypothetical protein RRG08_054488 [Elysia crispata]|uniref:Uncharacterized protein n=1 Tax=Elysia crispata TaxID=231223 RepID=A0AAE1DLA3_9GAST|nr:hypothetical protein RRG08_054488 [Elysia crispata]
MAWRSQAITKSTPSKLATAVRGRKQMSSPLSQGWALQACPVLADRAVAKSDDSGPLARWPGEGPADVSYDRSFMTWTEGLYTSL